MHCLSDAVCAATKYMTYPPSGSADTSGAQVRPSLAQAGSWGSASSSDTSHSTRSSDVANWTLAAPVFVAKATYDPSASRRSGSAKSWSMRKAASVGSGSAAGCRCARSDHAPHGCRKDADGSGPRHRADHPLTADPATDSTICRCAKREEDQHRHRRDHRTRHHDREVRRVGALQLGQARLQRQVLRAEQHVDRPEEVVPVAEEATAPRASPVPAAQAASRSAGRCGCRPRRRSGPPPRSRAGVRGRTAAGRRFRTPRRRRGP